MLDFKKQQNKLNQIKSERKYRPSFFGSSVHFDWEVVLASFLVIVIAVTIFGVSMQRKIIGISNKDYSVEVQTGSIEKIEIEKMNKIIDSLEK
jgi:hypothetical protein